MATFKDTVITTLGENLVTYCLANGVGLSFRQVKTSSNQYPDGTDFKALTDLTSIQQTVSVSQVVEIEPNTFKVIGTFLNAGVTTAYSIWAYGVYAYDPQTDANILFSVTPSEAPADTMPPQTSGGATFIAQPQYSLSGDLEINATLDPAGLVSQADLANYLPLAGGTMTGQIVQPLDPVADTDLVNKKYVDENSGPDGNFVTTDTPQTITAQKSFQVNTVFRSDLALSSSSRINFGESSTVSTSSPGFIRMYGRGSGISIHSTAVTNDAVGFYDLSFIYPSDLTYAKRLRITSNIASADNVLTKPFLFQHETYNNGSVESTRNARINYDEINENETVDLIHTGNINNYIPENPEISFIYNCTGTADDVGLSEFIQNKINNPGTRASSIFIKVVGTGALSKEPTYTIDYGEDTGPRPVYIRATMPENWGNLTKLVLDFTEADINFGGELIDPNEGTWETWYAPANSVFFGFAGDEWGQTFAVSIINLDINFTTRYENGNNIFAENTCGIISLGGLNLINVNINNSTTGIKFFGAQQKKLYFSRCSFNVGGNGPTADENDLNVFGIYFNSESQLTSTVIEYCDFTVGYTTNFLDSAAIYLPTSTSNTKFYINGCTINNFRFGIYQPIGNTVALNIKNTTIACGYDINNQRESAGVYLGYIELMDNCSIVNYRPNSHFLTYAIGSPDGITTGYWTRFNRILNSTLSANKITINAIGSQGNIEAAVISNCIITCDTLTVDNTECTTLSLYNLNASFYVISSSRITMRCQKFHDITSCAIKHGLEVKYEKCIIETSLGATPLYIAAHGSSNILPSNQLNFNECYLDMRGSSNNAVDAAEYPVHAMFRKDPSVAGTLAIRLDKCQVWAGFGNTTSLYTNGVITLFDKGANNDAIYFDCINSYISAGTGNDNGTVALVYSNAPVSSETQFHCQNSNIRLNGQAMTDESPISVYGIYEGDSASGYSTFMFDNSNILMNVSNATLTNASNAVATSAFFWLTTTGKTVRFTNSSFTQQISNYYDPREYFFRCSATFGNGIWVYVDNSIMYSWSAVDFPNATAPIRGENVLFDFRTFTSASQVELRLRGSRFLCYAHANNFAATGTYAVVHQPVATSLTEVTGSSLVVQTSTQDSGASTYKPEIVFTTGSLVNNTSLKIHDNLFNSSGISVGGSIVTQLTASDTQYMPQFSNNFNRDISNNSSNLFGTVRWPNS